MGETMRKAMTLDRRTLLLAALGLTAPPTLRAAETVAFLCSPRARHIQGVSLPGDGGATPGL